MSMHFRHRVLISRPFLLAHLFPAVGLRALTNPSTFGETTASAFSSPQNRCPSPAAASPPSLLPLHRHCCGLNPRHGGGGGQARERGGTGASEFPPRPPIGQEPGGGGSPSARFAVAAGRWPSGRAGPGARAGCGVAAAAWVPRPSRR